MLALSAAAVAFAPLLMPTGYSWLRHTTSESAAQGMRGAWLARLGFLSFGLALLWLASLAAWDRWGTRLHAAFGVLMLATAAFSHRPFLEGMAFDRTEDLLHSLTATGMGFAFAFGVLAVARWRNTGVTKRVLDWVAVAASVIIPLLMSLFDDYAGLMQRTMFMFAYVWYGIEAWSLTATSSPLRPDAP